MATQTIERPVQRPAADRPDPPLDDRSHTPPHGDALFEPTKEGGDDDHHVFRASGRGA